MWGFWVIPKVQLWSFLTVLRSFDTALIFLPNVFSPWSLPRVGSGIGKGHSVTTDHLPDISSTVGQRVRLTKKTRPRAASHVIPDPVPGHSTPRRWKRLHHPSSVRRGERGGRASQSFSSPWGLVILHLGTPGTCTRRLQA